LSELENRAIRKREDKYHEAEENRIMRSSIVCILHCDDQIEENEVCGACSTHAKYENYTQ
jgi:hypothetical protein